MCRKWLLIQRDHPFKPESGNSIPNGFLQIFFTVCSVFAHEFTHYLQWLHGRDMDNTESVEEDAEYMGEGLYGQFLTNKKDKKIRIDGCLSAWKTKAEIGEGDTK